MSIGMTILGVTVGIVAVIGGAVIYDNWEKENKDDE